MATQTTVTLVDDLDGSNADEQVEFTVDGKSYAIDLSSSNSQKLRDVLAPYISAARRNGGRRRSAPAAGPAARPAPRTDREQNQAIREWAQKQGLKVSERGRLSASVLDAFKAAH
ncbi:Lsr2 family protein [Pseudonocardia sp. DSM 110487]|uniref:histone-like nucleoid-structuring protein Lsr2 n=1 Tax=Pseudonocardia sp. DSM 110487 TaxID=2865833 RepID=UPI001C6997DF|nr:Lsr2 family protein [Pseudonocardia sp. DSM 110487]QYN37232.1 Lsr2 family protein [Pseudonocardia sp. DSM 110487]